MSEHPNAIRMRDTVDAFMTGDVRRLLDGFAENVRWYAPGHTPAGGTFRGRDGVLRFFSLLKEASAGSIRVEVEDVLAGDRYVTIFLTIAAERDAAKLNVLVAQFAAADEDGRWSRGWFLPDRISEWNRFFAGAFSATT